MDLGGARGGINMVKTRYTKFLKELILKSLKSCNMGRSSINNIWMESPFQYRISHRERTPAGGQYHHLFTTSLINPCKTLWSIV